MINTSKVIEKLITLPEGVGWKVLVWKNGEIATILGNGYAGEQNGDDPLLILDRNEYGELTDDDLADADFFEQIEELITEAGGEWTRP